MLSNCEKMVVISSTTNEWPQTHIDEKDLMAPTAAGLMEKPGQEQQQQQSQHLQPQQQQQQQALKCPRCDSSNTKFCYYNNYSLSQPRHFCKACKRYWTRGGTLRNVPVGGGCRKNKRVKRPASASSAIDGAPQTSASINPNPSISRPQIDVSNSTSTPHINPLFYGLANNPSDINLPFPAARFGSRSVSGVETLTGYDLQPQLNALGLGFSSGNIVSSDFNVNTSKQNQDVVTTSNPLLSTYSNIFGSSSSSTTAPTIASLLASTLHQHKFMNGGVKSTQTSNHFQALATFQDLQVTGNAENGLTARDVVKAEEGQSRMEWNVACQNQLEQIGLSDPAIYWNTTSVGGAWHDPTNIGSSVTSLI